MSDVEIIIKEKNDKINELKKEIENQKNSYEQKIANVQKSLKGSITKESAAREIYSRLNKIKIIGWIAVLAPPFAAILSGVNFFAGGTIGLFSAAGAVIMMKKEIISELQRLRTKYRL